MEKRTRLDMIDVRLWIESLTLLGFINKITANANDFK